MDLSAFEFSKWYEALTLNERIQAVLTAKLAQCEEPINRELAEKRFRRWRAQKPFDNDSYFRRWLASSCLTENDFFRLLGIGSREIAGHLLPTPAWLLEIERIYSDWSANGARKNHPETAMPGLLFIAEPMIIEGHRQFQEGLASLLKKYRRFPFEREAVENLFLPDLFNRLSNMATRTMVLELNVARMKGQLHGKTPEERFQEFNRQMRDPEILLAIWQEYPVLVRHLLQIIENHVRNSLEFLCHLCADWHEICELFSPENCPGLLRSIRFGIGDIHRNGRSVGIAEFTSGFRLVYKPRSLAVERHFSELLEWFNQRGYQPQFRNMKILARDNYGWVEYVMPHQCREPEEVQRFNRRLGALLALLYLLEATDFHAENLLAAGEHPVLVDLEALFHPRINYLKSSPVLEFSNRSISHSVLRTGLLPQQIWINEEGEGLDLSGMGGAAGQLTPFAVLTAEKYGTDEMCYIRKRMELASSRNRPNLNGAEIKPVDQAEDFIFGFSSMYRMIVEHREELLKANSPIYAFANDEVRLIARATKTYARLLQESYHPDMLRNALNRDQLLDRLRAGIDGCSEIGSLIPYELSALQKGEIPFITSRPSSTNLWSADGDLIEGLLEETSLGDVLKKLRLFTDDDFRRQRWFIRSSLATTGSGPDHKVVRTTPGNEAERSAATRWGRRDFLAAASDIGDHLIEASLSAGDLITWTGMSMIGEKRWSIAPVASDLYNGLSGIGLFFAYLGSLSKNEKYSTTARLAIETARRYMKETQTLFAGRRFGVGAFSGESGLIYTLTHAGQLWRESGLWDEAEELIASLQGSIARDRAFDIIGGAAGYLCVLSDYYQITRSSIARQSAIACAEHLLAKAQRFPQGIGWISPGANAPLTGFSHGVSGIAYALLRAGELTGDERFFRAALMAIAYERTHFITAEKNWQDLRQLSDSSVREPRAMTAWCHGAPGIGLARLYAIRLFNDKELRRELEIALETTALKGFGASHCLCHGDLGNLDLLIEAGRLPKYRQWGSAVRNIGGKLLNVRRDHGWLCSTPEGIETPGLMLGLSGIGYELLRLVDPEFVPSILLLQSPPENCRIDRVTRSEIRS